MFPTDDDSSEIVQRLESSLNFLVNDNDDNPPAIRGVMAESGDLQEDIRKMVTRIARDSEYPELVLRRLLWFDDKNEKLDEACEEAKAAFRPYPVTADGLISFQDPNNQLMDKPTQHRLVVSDEFANTNYNRRSEDDMILDEDEDEEDLESGETIVKENSWKRKITQTIKPWRVKRDGKIVPARNADDLMLTLNSLFSRTKHGWLVADLLKLKRRRGSVLVHARTYEYQKVSAGQRYEFLIQYLGAAAVYKKRLAKKLNNVSCLYLDLDEEGEIFVTKVSVDEPHSIPETANVIDIPMEAEIVSRDGRPSQVVLKKTGRYYESKLAPLLEQGKKLSTKIDLRKSNTAEKHFRFNLKIEMNGPLLVASSGDAVIFQLDDMLKRFVKTNLAEIRGAR